MAIPPQLLAAGGSMVPDFLKMIIGETQMAAPAPAPNAGLFGNQPQLTPRQTTDDSNLGFGIDDILSGLNQDKAPTALEDAAKPKMGLQDNIMGLLGGIDKGLQSPAQVLGLGLLGQLDQRLPLPGLLAMGLLNRTK